MRYSSGEWGLVMAPAGLLSGRSSPQTHWAKPMKRRCSGVKLPMGSSFFWVAAVCQALSSAQIPHVLAQREFAVDLELVNDGVLRILIEAVGPFVADGAAGVAVVGCVVHVGIEE